MKVFLGERTNGLKTKSSEEFSADLNESWLEPAVEKQTDEENIYGEGNETLTKAKQPVSN